MANLFTSVVKQYWSDKIQMNLEKTTIAPELCTMVDIPNGTTKNLPYVNRNRPTNYTAYSTQTAVDIVTGNDQLVITDCPMLTYDIDELDYEDNYINVQAQVTEDAGYMLRSAIDGDILGELLNANNVYNSNGLNGAGTAPIALTTGSSTNIPTVFGQSRAVLTNAGAIPEKLTLLADAFVLNDFNTVGMQNGFNVADESFRRGFRGDFLGMKVYETGNLTASVVYDMTLNVTAGEYISIFGQVFTFVASIGSTPGNVLIGGSAAASLTNLANAINLGAGSGTTYVPQADTSVLYGVSAVAAAATLTITSKRGRMYPVSSNTGTNDFQAETLVCGVMEKGAIHMSLRDSVRIKEKEVAKNLVTSILIWSRYGKKTTTRGKARMCRVLVQSTPAES
jgi:hypothetical protein